MADQETTQHVDGFWALYSYDTGPYLVSAWGNEVDALRALNKTGYGMVAFVNWGESLREADDRRLGITRDALGWVLKPDGTRA